MALTISDAYFDEIITLAGYPVIDITLLELTKSQMINLFIWPAVRDYFKWFPKQEEVAYNVSSTFSYDFPDSNTFGVLDARVNTSTTRGSGVTNSFIINSLNIRQSQGLGEYGTRHKYDLDVTRINEKMENRGLIDFEKAIRIRVDLENRKVVGYTNIDGWLNIIWAKYSEDFSDIRFDRIDEVIKLSQANILRYLGMLRNQGETDLPNELSGDDFVSTAEDLRDEVMDSWKSRSKIVLLRN